MVFKKDNVPWNKGIKSTEEHKENIRIAAARCLNYGMRNKHHTIETKEKIKEKKAGFKHTEEAKIKMSLYRKGRPHSEKWNSNVSLALKGKKKSPEHLRKLRLICSMDRKGKSYEERFGEIRAIEIKKKISRPRASNPNWRGGISYEPYSVNFNRLFKEVIKLRDVACLVCGNEIRSVHHIDYNKMNSAKENCCGLCRVCHSKTNFNREHWTKFFQSLLNEKYNYNYEKLLI